MRDGAPELNRPAPGRPRFYDRGLVSSLLENQRRSERDIAGGRTRTRDSETTTEREEIDALKRMGEFDDGEFDPDEPAVAEFPSREFGVERTADGRIRIRRRRRRDKSRDAAALEFGTSPGAQIQGLRRLNAYHKAFWQGRR
jgi:hypothetical protein